MATTLAEFRDELLAAIDADIAANETPVEGKIALLASVQQALAAGGGGGGSTTLTDKEYFYWRVKTADSALGLAVDDLVRESVVSDVSAWRKVGAGSNLASAPDNSKIELAGQSSIVAAVNSAAAAVTANQVTQQQLLQRLAPGIPISSGAGVAGQAAQITIPKPPLGQFVYIHDLLAGYHGGDPGNTGGELTINYGGSVNILYLPRITSPGPAPVLTHGHRSEVPGTGVDGANDGKVIITLSAITALTPRIFATYSYGAA